MCACRFSCTKSFGATNQGVEKALFDMTAHPQPAEGRKAVVLVSGGLDSATVLALARAAGFDCYALSFLYGQRHAAELEAARRVTRELGAKEHREFPIDLSAFGGSALTDHTIDVPTERSDDAIPITYVPARNTVFLSLALGWAEVLGARDLFIGANAVDYSGYPDCRPEFIEAFERLANVATAMGVEGNKITVHAPLIHWSKAEIIRRGIELGVDYGWTVSCYQADADGLACGECDSCVIRRDGFAHAGVADPTGYRR